MSWMICPMILGVLIGVYRQCYDIPFMSIHGWAVLGLAFAGFFLGKVQP